MATALIGVQASRRPASGVQASQLALLVIDLGLPSRLVDLANGLLTDALAKGRTRWDDGTQGLGETPCQGHFGSTRRYWLRRGSSVFKSPLAHQYDPGPDLGVYGIRGRS